MVKDVCVKDFFYCFFVFWDGGDGLVWVVFFEGWLCCCWDDVFGEDVVGDFFLVEIVLVVDVGVEDYGV